MDLDLFVDYWDKAHPGYNLTFTTYTGLDVFARIFFIQFKIYKDSIFFAEGGMSFNYIEMSDNVSDDLWHHIEKIFKAALPIESGPASIGLSKKYTKGIRCFHTPTTKN
jgi:hypothetical protein